MQRIIAAIMAGVLAGSSPVAFPQTVTPMSQNGGQSGFHISVDTSIVLTNVIVRDKKTGELIKDLKQSDFHITEDKAPQKILTFDYEDVDNAAALAEKNTITGKTSVAQIMENSIAASPQQLKDHRLIVMFFDMSSMQEEDIDRAVDSATKYVKTQMQPADLVSMVSMSTALNLDQDFTSDKDRLLHVLAGYNGSDASGFAAGGNGSTDGTSDDSSSFAADDSEFNSLNTDRELFAIRSIAQSLERVDQRKSMLYFSGGISKSGIENQASLRAATNAAAKANLAIYAVDSRGLEAMPPGGDASKGSSRGSGAYSGAAIQAQYSSNFTSQETLSTLAMDTGGKTFFDSNDFGPAFQAVQKDTEAYYILGHHSTNTKLDGTFRHITVTVDRPNVKLEFHPGYYAGADFHHQKNQDREVALTEQMRSEVPATDINLFVQALYFRQSNGVRDNLFYVPVSLIVPGSQIPFVKNGARDKATLDIMGRVQDAQGITVGQVRETRPLALDASQEVKRKNIQYSTGFSLAPGHYTLKFVVRENQSGNMGSFEAAINVPDLKKIPLKLSSVVLASQRTPNNVKNTKNPLVMDGQEFIPNISHIFRQDQHLYMMYEVYDPTQQKGTAEPAASPGLDRRQSGPVHVLTSIEFLQGGSKVFETPLVSADAINDPARGAISFQFDVPLTQLKPGNYVCQVNVIDDAGGSFSFPRMAVRVTAPAAAAPAPATSPTATPAPHTGN